MLGLLTRLVALLLIAAVVTVITCQPALDAVERNVDGGSRSDLMQLLRGDVVHLHEMDDDLDPLAWPLASFSFTLLAVRVPLFSLLAMHGHTVDHNVVAVLVHFLIALGLLRLLAHNKLDALLSICHGCVR